MFCACGKYTVGKEKRCMEEGRVSSLHSYAERLVRPVSFSSGTGGSAVPILLPITLKLLYMPERPGCVQYLHSQLYIQSTNYSHW